MTDPAARRRLGLAVPETMLDTALQEGNAAQLFRDLEADGVDSLWILDQLSGRARTSEPFTVLGYAAALTTRVRLGIAILVAASRGPLVAAKSLTSLDRLSRGRVTVGVGLGARWHYGSYGLADQPPGKVLDEFLVGLNQLWCEPDDRPPAWDGPQHWDIAHSTISPLPLQKPHPPIWVGGASLATYRRAVRAGTGWIGGGKQPFGDFCESVKQLRELIEPGTDFAVSKRVYLLVQNDRAKADEQLREWFGTFYNNPDLGGQVTVVGDADSCTEQLQQHYAAGANHLIVQPILGTRDQYDAVIGSMVPALDLDG